MANDEPDALERDPALDPALDQISRRTLLGRMSAGAAAVVIPAATAPDSSQQSRPTNRALNDTTLEKKEIAFPSDAVEGKPAEIKAFLAMPKSREKRGSVIVIHEIFGLNDHIRDVACRLAQAGYTALAPNLFTREGNPPSPQGGFEPLMQFVSKIPDRQIVGDLNAALRYLRGRPESNQKVGIVGFCYGGRVSMLFAGNAPSLNAAVAYYGRITGQKTENQPAHALDLVEKMKAPLLGHFGEKDSGIPPAEAEKLREALKAAGKTAEIYIYEGAGHAFNNDTRESYDETAAKLAWHRTLDWFKKYLS